MDQTGRQGGRLAGWRGTTSGTTGPWNEEPEPTPHRACVQESVDEWTTRVYEPRRACSKVRCGHGWCCPGHTRRYSGAKRRRALPRPPPLSSPTLPHRRATLLSAAQLRAPRVCVCRWRACPLSLAHARPLARRAGARAEVSSAAGVAAVSGESQSVVRPGLAGACCRRLWLPLVALHEPQCRPWAPLPPYPADLSVAPPSPSRTEG